ncbi:hypothetical protein STEG23_027254, partial [Scotinomys teguina]
MREKDVEMIRPYELICIMIDSEGLVILVSSTHSGFYNLSFSFAFEFPELSGKTFDGDFQFRLSFLIMSG